MAPTWASAAGNWAPWSITRTTRAFCCGAARRTRGTAGIAQGVAEGGKTYKPACIHYLHLGWVGATGNIHYYEIMDFAAGWAGLDPSGDDRGGFQSTMLASADAGPERDEPSDSPPPRPRSRRPHKAADHRFPIELLVP